MTALVDPAATLPSLNFSATSTAIDGVEGLDLTGRRAVVTGGAAGIGLEAARALALAGASVTLAVRDEYAGMRAAAEIAATTGNTDTLIARVDLAEPGSVAAFVRNWDGPLHMLVARIKDGKVVLGCVDTKEAATRFLAAPAEKLRSKVAEEK